MKTIERLLQDHERVWFYLQDNDAKNLFCQELAGLGASFTNDEEVLPERCSHIMAVHQDHKVAHLMIMIWNASFHPDFENCCASYLAGVPKVDYAKYIAGEDDFICHTSPFAG